MKIFEMAIDVAHVLRIQVTVKLVTERCPDLIPIGGSSPEVVILDDG
jgi:hypothetical protein